jgi:hypothetical protein
LCMEVTGQEATQLSLWGDGLHYNMPMHMILK